MGSEVFLDRLLQKLRDGRNIGKGSWIQFDEADLLHLCDLSIVCIRQDPILLKLDTPLNICGDVHGQFSDLMSFLQLGGFPPTTSYLFLGDYVDRGLNSIETLTTLLCLKCRYPSQVWLLRGNHETRDISHLYGFEEECASRYSGHLWTRFNDIFEYLPIAAIVSDRIFCVHGGLSKDLRSLSQISSLQRPLVVPESGLVSDLLWADPRADIEGYAESERGTSFTFGPKIAEGFLTENDFDLICRAHQVVPDGFEFPFFPLQTVVTVFSAPNYCEEFGNKGAMLKIDSSLTCSFVFVDPPANCHAVEEIRPVTPCKPDPKK